MDNIFNAMADRTTSDRGVTRENHIVRIENTSDIALAMINTACRYKFEPREVQSNKDMRGGIYYAMAACRRIGKVVEIQML